MTRPTPPGWTITRERVTRTRLRPSRTGLRSVVSTSHPLVYVVTGPDGQREECSTRREADHYIEDETSKS